MVFVFQFLIFLFKMFSFKNKIFLIAEAGVNHNGDIKLAQKLIDAAKKCGADAVKFQTFTAQKLVSAKAKKAGYQNKTTSKKESQLLMLKKLELDEREHRLLVDYCGKQEIIFMSTPFDEESADLLERLGMKIYKIPSGEITNFPLLTHIARKKKPVILSTGMSTLEEVKEAVEVIKASGNKALTVLHCVTEYPAPFDQINLRAMITLKNALQISVGFSDHTVGIDIPIAAAALGAQVIEKHLTLDRTLPGPDQKASLEPDEFKRMAEAIRRVEVALGDGKKIPAPCEKKYIPLVRKSVVALEDIPAGGRLTRLNVALKRPGTGIQPKDFEKVLGLLVKKDIQAEETITWGDLKN